MNDSTVQDELPTDNDQPDNMEVSGAFEVVTEKERQERKKDATESHSSASRDSSQFVTAPTHQCIYPSLPMVNTQFSFLTPSSQPSAPPLQLGDDIGERSPNKGTEQNEPIGGRDSPRITTLLALRSSRTGAKKPTGTSPPPPPPALPSSMAASSSSSRPGSSILESLQPAKKQESNASSGEKKLPGKTSPSKSGSSSKRKPSPKSVRHAVPVIASKSSPPSSSSSVNGTKTSSPELDFETAPEGVREGDSSNYEQAFEGEGENGKKSGVIIRTNTYTHLGTKRKSSGAFGSTSSTDSSTSSENWQTAPVSESGNNGGSSSSASPTVGGPTPTKRLRSLATPSAPSLRRALGGSKVTTPQPPQPPRNSSPSVVVKGSPKTATKNGSSQSSSGGGHSRSLSIGSGLAAILSRPVSGKLKSPTSSAAGGQKQGDPVVKKEPTSHSWIAQLFHKS